MPQSDKCKAPPVTAAEAKHAQDGNRGDFWKSRASRGDPISEAALDILDHEGFGGNFANQKLVAGILRRSPGTTPVSVISEARAIGVELMRAHVDAVVRFGDLSAEDVANYHYNVFGMHGLPQTTFGGTPITGTRTEARLTAFIWMDCQ